MKLKGLVGAILGLSCAGFSATSIAATQVEQHANVAVNSALQQALKSDFRKKANSQRDGFRHPGETLSFFGVTPEKTVIELWPGGGWYAEILAPYLAKKGQYIAANFETKPTEDNGRTRYYAKAGKKFEKWVEDNPAQLKKVGFATLNPPVKTQLGKDNSADVVLTFRNLHNWEMSGNLEPVFKGAYAVLKTGGVFGVVEHRANPGMPAKSGYMDPAMVIKLAEKVGFVLAESSEINANPKDTKDYPKGVWTLPPRLAMDDVDKAKYQAIGESDRMTLKFVKK
ncbi:class I SAM-dependent methyltransferase [Shewanella intestini]|uniref:Class I SAM-dependent methyltransferase n=1 Tax=Shewanella intestini TaxID=2017544 RepID=A0ABS5HZ70_9GAMM|nr:MULTISPECIES: class I SAM-dependent methyltransferase [Shewanella]MBR9727088.1 class I SAM-dependent methyltransferase [Shewanella intestini]MRG35890.1 methyltransferase [Shewanella sp. XMDDZSB0408]